jgi:CheY-like chemotaxis protein
MNGYELAQRVRQRPDLGRIVLVALTGYGRDEDRRRALAAGFDHHLVKPVDIDALQALVARLGKGEPGSGEPHPVAG